MDTIIQQMQKLNLHSPQTPKPVRPEVAITNALTFLYEENKRLKMYIEFLEKDKNIKHKSIPEWVL